LLFAGVLVWLIAMTLKETLTMPRIVLELRMKR